MQLKNINSCRLGFYFSNGIWKKIAIIYALYFDINLMDFFCLIGIDLLPATVCRYGIRAPLLISMVCPVNEVCCSDSRYPMNCAISSGSDILPSGTCFIAS